MANSNNPLIEAALQEYRAILEGLAPAPTPVVDPLVAQRNQVLLKQMQDREAEIIRNRDAARAKDEAFKRDRQKRLDQEQQARAEALERSLEEQALADYLARDGKRADFPKYYAIHKFELFDAQTRAQEQELRRKSPAYGAI